ncbi:predicted protein [Postia placenta Mad-698-R]|uniref:Uncharacterized protein n=1 Tax=Postia placenta MAD-698-R-SB12 TaxID=670580 RepID=A0A1X6N546_9APHY|nr:hypothetical protein POSPLADRAFT_1140123 [Postia placenta MAD-698-R-SB12]EED78507.1 predicted protein [Postia placenta Mad-698-R]OSX63737.1 hypothetical protein POSPLADRAFT_1140123 [Postia placenta MAD-698-R-SB12]
MEDPLFVDLREQEDLEVQRIREDFSQRAQAARDTRALIISVYRAVWGDFYRDEADACLSRINELATPFPTWPLSSSGDLSANAFGEVEDGMILGEVDHDEDSYIISDFEEAVRADVICTDYAASAFAAHAKYEACTPATRSIKTDDRSHVLQFVHMDGQTPMAVEHLRTLSLSHETIDGYAILPPLKWKDEGLLRRMRQRDMWFTTSYMPPKHLQLGLLKHVNEIVDVFCPSLNCIEALCMTHKEPSVAFGKKSPKISNSDLRWQNKQPCGQYCYLIHLDATMVTIA